MKIWLDDQIETVRPTPEGWVGAKNPEEFRILINEAHNKNEPIEAIDFDNDLGEDLEEGYDLLIWLKETYPQYVVGETELKVHSANSVRNIAMEEYISWCKENAEEILAAKERENPWGEIERGPLKK